MRKLVYLAARSAVWLTAELQVEGYENIPATGGYIAASNHLGRLDAALPLTLSPRNDLILMIAEKYQDYAIWRFVARHLDALWLNRFDADYGTLREVIRRLKAGQYLAIAPEGTRSQSEMLQQGKSGVVFLAAKAKVPVVPVAIQGTEDRVMWENLKRLRRSKVVVRAGEPYHLPPMPRRGRDAYMRQQTDEIMCRIAQLLPEKYHGHYARHPQLRTASR